MGGRACWKRRKDTRHDTLVVMPYEILYYSTPIWNRVDCPHVTRAPPIHQHVAGKRNKAHRCGGLGHLQPNPLLTPALLDWIEDSILERNRRLREAEDVYASNTSANGRITLSWLITHARKLLAASQTWFVVTIVGELISRHRSSGANADASVFL